METDFQNKTLIYEAQTSEGEPISGTIEADGITSGRDRLESLGLRVLEMKVTELRPRPKRLRGADWLLFNQQLAQLTKAGLPLEHGLRIIGKDTRNGRLSHTIQQVADELDADRPLSKAFEIHCGRVPSFYRRLLEVGVKTHNLPRVLFGLGRHLDMIRRLRPGLWQIQAICCSWLFSSCWP